jgi:hypothetical protein
MNRQTKWLLKEGRATKNVQGSSPARAEHIVRPLFKGKQIDSRKLRAEAGRKPRDEGRKLRALSDKRVLDKRITAYAAAPIYAH